MQFNKFTFNNYYKSAKYKATPVINNSDSRLAKKYKRKINGKTLTQFDNEYWSYIFELINNAKEYSQQEKNEIVENITEYYSLKTNNPVPNTMLNALADFLLDDSLSDKDRDKVSKNQYPILSYRQLQLRQKRESTLGNEVIEFIGNVKKHNITMKKNSSEKSVNL